MWEVGQSGGMVSGEMDKGTKGGGWRKQPYDPHQRALANALITSCTLHHASCQHSP